MKVCIICYGLRENNVRLQPWRYITEIAAGILSKGVDVKIITDGAEAETSIMEVPVIFAGSLRAVPFRTNESLLNLIENEVPDVVLWSMGPIDYVYLKMFEKVNIPVIGMFTGPIYKVSDITRIGFNEIVSNFTSLSVQLLYASLPSFFSKNLVNSPFISRVFVMSRKNKEMLVNMGADSSKIIHVPAGIDEYDLIVPESHESVIEKFDVSPGSFNILYFGSPAKIRGIDSAIKAVSLVAKNYPDIKLLILSRRRDGELTQEESEAINLIADLRLENNVQIVSGFLEKEDVKSFIKYCDLVVLPFKIVPSDIPTSILESMAMGKTVLSTNVDGIPELLEEGRGFAVNPGDYQEIASKIISCLDNTFSLKEAENRSLAYMNNYPRWSDVTSNVIHEIDSLLSGGITA
jgi:glycosyltransferase involved in cell wall biosynthesis